jgi:hypothetical protein
MKIMKNISILKNYQSIKDSNKKWALKLKKKQKDDEIVENNNLKMTPNKTNRI